MARRTGLGRGLDALIPSSGREFPSGSQSVALDQIIPNPRQPRRDFKPAELENLARSIQAHGILQPLIVTPPTDQEQEKYILIAGERRLMAAKLAGLSRVPVIIRSADDQQQLELALIENIQRADLNPLEAAAAYQQLIDEFNLSHEEIGHRVGKSRTAVTNTIRLLRLTPSIQKQLRENVISEGHARALLALPAPSAQEAALQSIINNDLTVRQTEALVKKLQGERPKPRPAAQPSPLVEALEERLRNHLGTKVTLNHRKRGGTLVIHYYSAEELDSLIDRILSQE